MRIVCGTDFSVHAAQAASVAAELAMRLEETLVLIHVVDNSELDAVSPKLFDKALGGIRARLVAEAERLRQAGATVEEELLRGSPYQALVEAGRRPSTRLLVVSSLGQIAPSRFLVGSVAERTAESSSVPTLVVRDAAPFQAWMRGERPLRIFLGYDFSATSDAALCWASALRKIGPCEITADYVAWPPQERWRLGFNEPTQLESTPDEVRQLLERDLNQRVRNLLGEESVQIRVETGWGRPDLQLIESANAEKAGLFVIGTHQRHGVSRFWLGSVSRGILHHAPMSIAVVPASTVSHQQPTRIPEFRRVLVTTDFSDWANRAIGYAYSALPRGGKVCLLHVIAPASQKEQRKQINDDKTRLRSLIPAGAEARGIESQIEVIESRKPSQAICQVAERFGADLICMASHGRSGLSKAIMGSVAQEVMTCNKRPILIVRPPDD